MDVEFRSARSQDDTPQNRRLVLEMAMDYAKESKDSSISAADVETFFERTVAGQPAEAAYWMMFDDGHFSGYMLVSIREEWRRKGAMIWQGFMQKGHRHQAGPCLRILEEAAKQSGLSFVSLITRRNPKVYARWIGRFGYGQDHTAFHKEI